MSPDRSGDPEAPRRRTGGIPTHRLDAAVTGPMRVSGRSARRDQRLGGTRWRDSIRTRIVLAVLVLAAVTWALVRNWSDVAQHLRAVSPLGLLGGAVGALAAPNLTMLGWRALVAFLERRRAHA